MGEPTTQKRAPSYTICRALVASLVVIVVNLSGMTQSPLFADESGQAALVIQYDEARVETSCLPLEGELMTGMELLDRSGLNMIVQPGSSMGVTICQIEGVGCAYPAKACFCQCMGGGDCAYWNYFYREPGGDWIYSALGAVMHKVQPGAVEAWVWGDGTKPPADDWTYEIICPSPTEPAPTEAPPTEAPPAQAPPTDTPTMAAALPEATSQPEAEPTATPIHPTSTATLATPTPQVASAAGSDLASYGFFAVMALALVGLGLWVRRRQA